MITGVSSYPLTLLLTLYPFSLCEHGVPVMPTFPKKASCCKGSTMPPEKSKFSRSLPKLPFLLKIFEYLWNIFLLPKIFHHYLFNTHSLLSHPSSLSADGAPWSSTFLPSITIGVCSYVDKSIVHIYSIVLYKWSMLTLSSLFSCIHGKSSVC